VNIAQWTKLSGTCEDSQRRPHQEMSLEDDFNQMSLEDAF